MCHPNITSSEFVAIFVFMIFFSLHSHNFVSICKKRNSPLLLLLNKIIENSLISLVIDGSTLLQGDRIGNSVILSKHKFAS